MRTLLISIVAGARPNFMKIGPIVRALQDRKASALASGLDLRLSIVHTGQHYDENMSEVFFRDLMIPKPDRHLEVGAGSHAGQTAKIMVAFEKVILEDRPNWVIVVGDVNSTLACALTAKKMGVKVAHVEAGLRSFDMTMPEEINRKITDAICDFLFVTEESGVRNLRAEGVAEDKIALVGNVMIDSLMANLARIDRGEVLPSPMFRAFCDGRRFAVLTLHRPGNVDRRESLEQIWSALTDVVRQIPILFPVHPRTRANIVAFGLNGDGFTMIDPVGYLDMLYAVRNASLVLTDSGGLQEETTVLGIPCITIRENTERPVTIDIGTNYLVGRDPEKIKSVVAEVLSGRGKKGVVPPFWDGKASDRIAATLIRMAKCE